MVPVFWPSATDVKTKKALNESTKRKRFFFIAPPIFGSEVRTKYLRVLELGRGSKPVKHNVASFMQQETIQEIGRSTTIRELPATENLDKIRDYGIEFSEGRELPAAFFKGYLRKSVRNLVLQSI